jgi:large subunit ribosomal protein L20
MPRAKGGFKTRRRRKKILERAKGYHGAKSRLFRIATEAVDKALQYSYRDRKNKKREFRSLWIARINAAARALGLTYSQLMSGLKMSGVGLDRKSLAHIAYADPEAFGKIVETAKKGPASQMTITSDA